MAIQNCKLPTVKHIQIHRHSRFSDEKSAKRKKKIRKNSDWIASASMAEIGFFVNEIEFRSAKTFERRRRRRKKIIHPFICYELRAMGIYTIYGCEII